MDLMLFAQLYPDKMCAIEAASYRYDIQCLVTEYGEALVREQGALTPVEQRRVAHLARLVKKSAATEANAAEQRITLPHPLARAERPENGLSVDSRAYPRMADDGEAA